MVDNQYNIIANKFVEDGFVIGSENFIKHIQHKTMALFLLLFGLNLKEMLLERNAIRSIYIFIYITKHKSLTDIHSPIKHSYVVKSHMGFIIQFPLWPA